MYAILSQPFLSFRKAFGNFNISTTTIASTFYTGFLSVVPWAFLFSLPILHFGIWIDIEGVRFFLATLTFFHIFFSSIFLLVNSNHTLRFKKDWETFTLSALALVLILTLPFHQNIALSWFGHPENGVGIWFIVFLLSVRISFQFITPQQHAFIKGNAITALISIALLTFFMHPHWFGTDGTPWVLYHFTDYLVWPTIGLVFLAARDEKRRTFYCVFSFVLCILSQNRTLLLALALALPILLIARTIKKSQARHGFLAAILVATPLGFPWLLYIINNAMPIPGITSRFISLKIVMSDLLNGSFWNIFTGMGFGQMSDAIIKNTLLIGEKAFQDGQWNPTWEGIGRYDGSSLNQFADFFHGGGLFACLLYALLWMLPFLRFLRNPSPHVDSRFIFLGTFCFLCCASFWFIMPATFALFAVLHGLSTNYPSKMITLSQSTCRKVSAALLVLASVFFITSRQMYFTGAFYSSDLPSLSTRFVHIPPLTAQNLVNHRGPGSVHFAFWLREYLKTGNTHSDLAMVAALHHIYQSSTPSLNVAESMNQVYFHFAATNTQVYLGRVFDCVERSLPHRPDLWQVQPL